MSDGIKAIPTWYNGIFFRSRLEAKWAAFMDHLHLPYAYELEGFEQQGLRYLPDFYLPSLDCWIEIKPFEPTETEWRKAEMLARGGKWRVFVICEPIPTSIPNGRIYRVPGRVRGYVWSRCPGCLRYDLALYGLAQEVCGGTCTNASQENEASWDDSRILAAYDYARNMRFDKAGRW